MTEKIKYMTAGSKMQDIRSPLVSGGHKYLGSLVTEDNNMAEEIKEKLSAGNRCYFSLQGIRKYGNMSRATKIQLYKTVLKLVVMYGSCLLYTSRCV